jgi:hypothetical protein
MKAKRKIVLCAPFTANHILSIYFIVPDKWGIEWPKGNQLEDAPKTCARRRSTIGESVDVAIPNPKALRGDWSQGESFSRIAFHLCAHHAISCWEGIRRHAKAFAAVSSISAAALLTPSPVRAQLLELAQTFNNPTPVSFDNFGYSLAISGSNALIGAPLDTTNGIEGGSAYLFDITTGTLLQTFNNPTPAGGDFFGNSVAISGNNALIGAPYDATGGVEAGSAYLFDITTGTLLQTFNNPTPAGGDFFGNSVAISGNNALIGAPHDATGGVNAGIAYLFDITTGTLLQTINNPTPAIDDIFGSSVAISGNNALIGAPLDATSGVDAGTAYLFDITTGTLLQTFDNPTPARTDFFGNSLAISGKNALIGAPLDDTGGADAGSAYLFDITTGALLQTIINPTPASDDSFGNSVAISGNNALIGAPLDDAGGVDASSAYLVDITTGSPPQQSPGTAYLFDITTGILLQTINNPTPANDDRFGISVAISGNNALIGAPRDATGGVDAGSAYLYAKPAPVQKVPGPLPLLGVGAAFGWSRTLRRRIGRN